MLVSVVRPAVRETEGSEPGRCDGDKEEGPSRRAK